MRGAIRSLLQYAFMVWCSYKKSTGTTLALPFEFHSNRRSSINADTKLRTGRPVFNSRLGQGFLFFFTPSRPDRYWSPRILSNG